MSTGSLPPASVVRVGTQEEADRLIAAGGRLRRCAHEMGLLLDETEGALPAPAGLQVAPLAGSPDAIAAAAARATPAGHPDHEAWVNQEARAAYWRRLLEGSTTGPLFSAASSLLMLGHEIVGAIAVTILTVSWWGSDPWIAEVFVVPGHQGNGLGAFLVRRAIGVSQSQGYERIGLTVTDGNRAEDLYRRLGFRRLRTTWIVER